MRIHRDSLHHVPVHVAVLHRLRRLFGVRRSHVLHKGVHHPVNAHWHEANTAKWPQLAGRSRYELRGIQDALLLKSNSVALTQDELAYLRAANNHFDVRTAINLLKGRDHRDFGFDGVDQVHMNTHTLPCGCKLMIVFDHHKARAGTIDKVHPHTPQRACRHHIEHVHDLDRMHDYVASDSNNPEFQALLKQEEEAEKQGLPLPPKWAPQGRA
jgi:hypothetical protein